MIILDTTSQSLEVNLGNSAVTTNQLDWTVSYVTITTATYTPGSAVGTTDNNTAQTIISNTANTIQVKFLSVFNNDTTDKIVIIQKVNGANTRTLCRIDLRPNETLQYNDGEGFSVLSTTGLSVTPGATVGISAGTQSASGANTIVFSNSNGLSFGLNTNSVLTGSVSGVTVSFWDTPDGNLQFNSMGSSVNTINIHLRRIFFPYYMSATQADIIAVLSFSTQTNITAAVYHTIGVYGRSGSSCSLLSEATQILSFSGQGATNVASQYSGASGTRVRSFTLGTWNFTPGDYYLAYGLRVSTSTVAASWSIAGFSAVGVNAMPYTANTAAQQVSPDLSNWGVAGGLYIGSSDLPPVLNYDQVFWAGSTSSQVVNRQPYFRFYGTYGT